jgi:hypothetical protein
MSLNQVQDKPVQDKPVQDKPVQETTETATELLQRLERGYVEKAKVLIDLKDHLNKVQDQVLDAHNNSFKAYQSFSNAKENYLVGVINTQNTRLEQLDLKSNSLPVVTEKSRSDNVQA